MNDFVHPSILSTALFLLLLGLVQLALQRVVYLAGGQRWVVRSVSLMTFVGLALTALTAWVITPTFFPPLAVAIMSQMVLTLALAFSRVGLRIGLAVTPAFWLLLHGFRLPLEILMHGWAGEGTMPPQMTWTGQNIDVLAGIIGLTAGFALWFGRERFSPTAKRRLAIGANVLGLLLLLNVIRIVMTSVPSPFRQFEEPLLFPFYVPYVLIGPFAVMVALFSHIVALRALLAKNKPSGTGESGALAEGA